MSIVAIGDKTNFYECVIKYIKKNYINEKINYYSIDEIDEINKLFWHEDKIKITNVFFITSKLDNKILDKASYLKRIDNDLSIFAVYKTYEIKGKNDQISYLLSKVDTFLKDPVEKELIHQIELSLRKNKIEKYNETEQSFKSSFLKGELNIKEEFFAKNEFGDKVLDQTKEIPLRISLPDTFKNFLDNFLRLLKKAVRKRIYQEEDNEEFEISKEINKMARELYHLMALPKDILDIYSEALRKINKGMFEHNLKIYIDEGRILVIELIGYLVLYYRLLYVI